MPAIPSGVFSSVCRIIARLRWTAVKLRIALLLGLAVGCACPHWLWAADTSGDQVVYVNSGRDAVAATLVPDQNPGSVPNDPSLVEATANDNAIAIQLAPGQSGQMDLSGKLPGLSDGRHRGAVKTLTREGGQKDRKELLIFVDSKPPLIERVEPEGDIFPRTAGAIRFRITDPEEGSGVSIDPVECALNVAVNGAALQNKNLFFEAKDLNLTVFVAFPGGVAEHDSSFTVSVSLQDRAGNVGQTSETFTIGSLTPPLFNIYPCGPGASYIQTTGEFLVEPAYSGMALSVGRERQLDIFTRGCFGKHYVYPDEIRAIMRKSFGFDQITESEFVTMNTFFQKAASELIKIRSASGKVAVRKLKDGDFKDSRVSFSISQPNRVPLGDQIDTLLVTVPVSVSMDKAQTNFCQSANQVRDYDEDDNIYYHIPEDAFIYTFETIAIPVYLEAADEPFSLRVEQEGDQLTAQVRFSPIEMMDTGASWFEFLGNKYWFERRGEACVAQGPAREGTVHFKVGAAHKIAEFLNPAGGAGATSHTMTTEGDVVVCLDPPMIKNFRYDRQTNTLKAGIDDQGTPLEDLSIALWVSGNPLDPEFDTQTGELTAELPFTPVSVQTASLRVTDLAKQTTADNCQVFGEASPEEDTPESTDAAVHKPYNYSPNTSDVDKMLGITGNGKAIVEICEEVMRWGYFRNGEFVPISSQPGTLKMVQLRSRDPYNSPESSKAISERLPLHVEIMGEHYDTRRYEPIPQAAGGVTSLVIANNQTAGSGRAFYYVVMARDGNRDIPISNPCPGFNLVFRSKKVKECHIEERDILAPVIRPNFEAGTQVLRAAIHDHGMPLSELEIKVKARSDSANSIASWGYQSHDAGSQPDFTFQNGILTSQFVPPPKGEFFTLRIDAKDKAGNRSFVDIDVVIPREPPDVNLTAETQQSHQSTTRNGVHASAFMTGEARDDSRIIPEKTTLWLDEQALPPFTLYSHTPEAGWRSQFNYKAGYAAGVEEGSHLARFRATDATGLWAETTAAFDFKLAPYIYDFKVMPDAVRQIGGPALTAMIIDMGGDLDIGGLSLTIDGQPVDPSHFYFDPASGYFSVDGPLELADGSHRAEITAMDGHGNQASDSLRFTRAAEITTAYQGSGQGLFIENLTLMELEHQNGDGQANPGELVRLFITLRNDTDHDLACIGRLTSEDIDILVETAGVDYGLMLPGSTVVPMKGFDLNIGEDILEKTISDPYEAYLDLTLDCGPAEEVVLPLKLPIYQPSIPIDAGLTLTLDRMPPTTTADSFRVRGTVETEAEFIEWMEIRVNGTLQGPVSFNRDGGRFEAMVTLTDGANTIEVSGADSSGEKGSAAGYIFRTVSFTPPSITITSPSSGDSYQCGELTVTGTYSTGSGTLGDITVDAPWAGGNCPVTIIDGSTFSVNCGDVIYGPTGIYDIEATITTTEGAQASDAIIISVRDCS